MGSGGSSSRSSMRAPDKASTEEAAAAMRQKKRESRRATIAGFMNCHEIHVRMLVETGNGLSKEKVKSIYPDCPQDVFNAVYGLFDWDEKAEDGGLSTVKMFSLMLISIMTGAAETVEDDMDLLFTIFDTEKKGTLTREEFRVMLRSMLGTRETTLKLLMKSEQGHQALMQFAQSEFSDENIQFIDAVDSWEEAKDYSTETAGVIMAQFVKDGAATPLNLAAKVKKKLNASFDKAVEDGVDVAENHFEEGVKGIYKLLEKDLFVRFQKQTEQMDAYIDSFFDEADSTGSNQVTREEYRDWAVKRPEALEFLRGIKKKWAAVKISVNVVDVDVVEEDAAPAAIKEGEEADMKAPVAGTKKTRRRSVMTVQSESKVMKYNLIEQPADGDAAADPERGMTYMLEQLEMEEALRRSQQAAELAASASV